MQFIVDEDLATDIARIGRQLELDIVSVHEVGREGWTDEEQLIQAAIDQRCIVTGNRNDFINLTTRFAEESRPHAGVVIVQRPLRDMLPAAVARALIAFDRARGDAPTTYLLIFLQPAP